MIESINQDIFLSIVIPVFNEEKILNQAIREMESLSFKYGTFLEFIIVNDNSIDKSLEIIQDKLADNKYVRIISNETRKGKASCVSNGIMAAQGKYIIFMDADLSVPLKEVDKFLKYMKGGIDIIIGIRDESNRSTVVIRPFYRKMISWLYNGICNLLFFKQEISDIGCGFKAFKREAAQDLFSNLYIKSWVFDTEILSKALRNNYKIVQLPVDWVFRGHSSLNIYKDLTTAFFELLKLKLFFMSRHHVSR